jgi:hypothetical protein
MPILEYYPCKEMADQLWQFMYAFNREDTDIYDCIITDENPSIECGPEYSGMLLNSAFYSALKRLHKEYGDMKLGYVRINDVVYCSVPYIEGLRFLSRIYYQVTNRMHSMGCHPFDGGKLKIEEFIRTNLREPDDLFSHIPQLIHAVPLHSVPTERFAAKLFFDNGECRKYVLPISAEAEEDEVVSYRGHVFSDGIWASITVSPHHQSRYKGYPECGPAIMFKNEFYVAGTRCYVESEPYSEPELIDEIVYSHEKYQIRKIWTWNVNDMYEDGETGLLKVLVSGQAFNWYGKAAFASIDGKRITSLTFDIIDNFQEGLARIAVSGYGYGFVDKDMNLVIPMKYDEAETFRDGKAKVRLRDKWITLTKTAASWKSAEKLTKVAIKRSATTLRGCCRVLHSSYAFMDLAYHSIMSILPVHGDLSMN